MTSLILFFVVLGEYMVRSFKVWLIVTVSLLFLILAVEAVIRG